MSPGNAIAAINPFLNADFVYDKSSPLTHKMKARVFSGIQPTGSPHIGNYLGALKNWVKIQHEYECIWGIVDLHAITNYQKPEELRHKIVELAGVLIAIGLDPKHTSIVAQSMIPAHAELGWMLTCVTPIGWLERMTQYKSKAQAQETSGGMILSGIMQYPVLMAADILLYQAAVVPVGDDQSQHLELARDIAQRFNSLYGETFVMPATKLPTVGARVMGLDEPDKKMSKSATGPNHAISLLDDPKVITKKIMRATTDSNPAVDFETMGAGVRNLLSIYQAFTECSDDVVKSEFSGLRYGDMKKKVAEAVVGDSVLRESAARVSVIADDTVQKTKKAMGLYTA